MKYRRKSPEVTAHRLGDDGWPDDIWDGVNRNIVILRHGEADVLTAEGFVRVVPGDWIVRDKDDNFYRFSDAVFSQLFEAAQ